MSLVTRDPVASLPELVSLQMFSYLNPEDLGKSASVCRRWKKIAESDVVWREVAKRILGMDLQTSNTRLLVKEIMLQTLRSDAEIIERIQAFANRVQLGQNGSFRCIFPVENKCLSVGVEIKGRLDGHYPSLYYSIPADIKEDYYGREEIGSSPFLDDITELSDECLALVGYINQTVNHFVINCQGVFCGAVIRLYQPRPGESPHLPEMREKMEQIVRERVVQMEKELQDEQRYVS